MYGVIMDAKDLEIREIKGISVHLPFHLVGVDDVHRLKDTMMEYKKSFEIKIYRHGPHAFPPTPVHRTDLTRRTTPGGGR